MRLLPLTRTAGRLLIAGAEILKPGGWIVCEGYDLAVRCGYRLPDGLTCGGPAFVLDARRGRMLCRHHALMPLERRFGPRADLEQKAEYALRFLALPSVDRHDILEALGSEERREFMQIALTFATDD